MDVLYSMSNLAPSSEYFDASETAESCENIPEQSTTPLYTLSRIQSIQIDMIDDSSNSEFDGIIRDALVSRKTKEPQILEDDDSKVEDILKINNGGSFSSMTEISEDAELLKGVDKRLHRFYKKRAKWKRQDGDDAKQKRSLLFGGWTLRTGRSTKTKPHATTSTSYSSWGLEKSSREEEPLAVEEFDDPLADFDSGFDEIDRWKSRNNIKCDDEIVKDDSETKNQVRKKTSVATSGRTISNIFLIIVSFCNQATESPSRKSVQLELSKYIQLVERTKERLVVLRRSRIALEALMEGTKSDLQRAQSLVTRCTVKRRISSSPSANTDEFKVDEKNSKVHPYCATSTVLEKPQDDVITTIYDGDGSLPDPALLIEQKMERLAIIRRSRCALEALMDGTKSDLKRAESLVVRCTAAWPSPHLLAALIEVEEDGDGSTIRSQSSAETSSQ